MPIVKVYHKRGGGEFVAADGGKITMESGSTLAIDAGATVSGLTGQTTFASTSEAKAGTNTTKVISPARIHDVITNCKVGTFSGNDGAGECVLIGAGVGDKVVGVAGLTDMGIADSFFETTITVADQIQQSSSTNLEASNFLVFLLPAA